MANPQACVIPQEGAKNGMVAEITNWRAESLRATTFYNTNETVPDVAQVWESVAGRSPERVSSRPREGIQTAEGGLEDTILVVTSQPERIDLNIRPALPAPNVRIRGFLTLGLLSETLMPFLENMRKWLRESPPSTRLAFGSVLLVDTESVAAGNERMDRMLPNVQLDAEGSSDFFYQINRRRRSLTTSGVLVNRLSKWSVAQGGSVGIFAGAGTGIQLSSEHGFFACRLELDVNTVGPQNHPIPKAKITDLFEELASLGKEIADKGDIP